MLTGKIRFDVLRRFGPPDAYLFDSADGTSYFVYQRDRDQYYSYDSYTVPLNILLTGIGGTGIADVDLGRLDYKERERMCILLKFDPDMRLMESDTRKGDKDSSCTGEFRSFLATSRQLSTDILSEELKTGLQALSGQGDFTAARELAVIFNDFGPLERLAVTGDADMAYEVHRAAVESPRNGAVAWKWLCVAAERGNVRAGREIAWWHTPTTWDSSGENKIAWARIAGLTPDNRLAYMWYTVAASRGDKQALGFRELVSVDMTAGQIAEAEEMIRDGRRKECPGEKGS